VFASQMSIRRSNIAGGNDQDTTWAQVAMRVFKLFSRVR
jgi:hypothetical protein